MIKGGFLLYYENIYDKNLSDVYIVFGDYKAKDFSYGKCDEILSILKEKNISEEKLLFFSISKGGTIAYKLNLMFNKSKLVSVIPQKSTVEYFNQRPFLMWGVKRYLSKEYNLIYTIEDVFLIEMLFLILAKIIIYQI